MLGNKKANMVAKDMAKALWGDSVLAERSFGGRVAPKDRGNGAAVPRPPLTPEKVALVVGTWSIYNICIHFFGAIPAQSANERFEHLPDFKGKR